MSRDRIQNKTKTIFAYLASHFHPEVVKELTKKTTQPRGAGLPMKGRKKGDGITLLYKRWREGKLFSVSWQMYKMKPCRILSKVGQLLHRQNPSRFLCGRLCEWRSEQVYSYFNNKTKQRNQKNNTKYWNLRRRIDHCHEACLQNNTTSSLEGFVVFFFFCCQPYVKDKQYNESNNKTNVKSLVTPLVKPYSSYHTLNATCVFFNLQVVLSLPADSCCFQSSIPKLV